MYPIPNNAKKIELENATVEFYEFNKDEIEYIYFDTSLCSVPEPMINALLGLKLISNTKKKLLMLNHSVPNALFQKIDKNFDFIIEEYEDIFIIEFSNKIKAKEDIDYENNQCSG